MAGKRLIKKYANRRLYDATSKKHLTLEELGKLIVDGEDIEIVDDKSGDDITRQVLLQVIAEQEQGGQPMFSAALLQTLIRFYGNPMQGLMSTYLENSVATFMQQQEKWQTQMGKWLAETPMATMAELTKKNLDAWQTMQESLFGGLRGGRKADEEDQ